MDRRQADIVDDASRRRAQRDWQPRRIGTPVGVRASSIVGRSAHTARSSVPYR
jgi:hypothetical protein